MSSEHIDGYTCHGPMVGVEWPHIYDGVGAWLCLTCGVWRHRFPPREVSKRAQVEQAMAAELVERRMA